MHAHPVAIGVGIAVIGLGLGDVGARIGAPDFTNRAHRTGALAQQGRVGFPVDLLVLKADHRNVGVGALLERASLPAVDDVGAIDALGSGLGNLHAANHPAAAGIHLVLVAANGHAIAREAVGRVLRAGTGAIRADRSRQVRAVAGVAGAELLRIAVSPEAPVNPLVGVGVARVLHVVRLIAERRAGRLAEQVNKFRHARCKRIGQRYFLRAADRAYRPGKGGSGLRAGVTRHEGDLVIVIQSRHRVWHGVGVFDEALTGRVPGLAIPGVAQLHIGAGVERETRVRVGQEVWEALVYLHRDLGPGTVREAEGGDLADRRGGWHAVKRHARRRIQHGAVVRIANMERGAFRNHATVATHTRGIGVGQAESRRLRPIREGTAFHDDGLGATVGEHAVLCAVRQ